MLPTTGRTARDVSPDQAARLFAAECDQAALEVFERQRRRTPPPSCGPRPRPT